MALQLIPRFVKKGITIERSRKSSKGISICRIICWQCTFAVRIKLLVDLVVFLYSCMLIFWVRVIFCFWIWFLLGVVYVQWLQCLLPSMDMLKQLSWGVWTAIDGFQLVEQRIVENFHHSWIWSILLSSFFGGATSQNLFLQWERISVRLWQQKPPYGKRLLFVKDQAGEVTSWRNQPPCSATLLVVDAEQEFPFMFFWVEILIIFKLEQVHKLPEVGIDGYKAWSKIRCKTLVVWCCTSTSIWIGCG